MLRPLLTQPQPQPLTRYYDPFRGVIVFVRVVDGVMRKGDTVHFAASGMEYEIIEVGTRTPGCTYSLWL